MLTFIFIAVAVILVTIGLVKIIDVYMPSKFKPVVITILWLLIFFLAYKTYSSIYSPILFNKEKQRRYAKVIEKLIDIRNTEVGYKNVNGRFTDNFDDLIKFIETGKFTITERRTDVVLDKELTNRFGVETTKEVVVVDTLGYVSVKDSLFKNSTRYKSMMHVPVGKPNAKFELKAGFIEQNKVKIPVFEASIKKDIILYDQDKDLLAQENQVISVDGVNGNTLKVGSMTEVNTNGNWPKTYGSND